MSPLSSFDISATIVASPRTLLTVAGHDPGSGAGVSADLATFAAHGYFGTSIITALTVQSTVGVRRLQAVDAEFLHQSLDFLAADLPPAGVKVGMLATAANVIVVGSFLAAAQQGTPRVFDPILRSSSGADLLAADALEALHKHLLPAVDWITPNWSELAALTRRKAIASPAEAERAAAALGLRHPHLAIVATGGDQAEPTDHVRLPSGETHWFTGEHIESSATHGTGCAFSSALLARLVEGLRPTEAVAAAKEFVTEAIHRAPGIGQGKGPMNLLWPLLPR